MGEYGCRVKRNVHGRDGLGSLVNNTDFGKNRIISKEKINFHFQDLEHNLCICLCFELLRARVQFVTKL